MNTIAKLRRAGIKTRVAHYRFIEFVCDSGRLSICKQLVPMHEIRAEGLQNRILPNGGITIVEITQGNKTIESESICSDSDHYNNKTGVALCLAKSEKFLNLVS
jgi:hypothetical protein